MNGIFSSNDGMALGAVAALREVGKAGKIPVTGSDGSSDVLRLIKAGDMLSTMYINGYVQGATATALAIAAVKGDVDMSKLSEKQRDFYLSQTLVTKENADDILNQKMNADEFTYEKMKADFWKFSVGQIPAGANN
ncbi:D-ribose-binding protein (fragment) [Agrobacterium tumefaciens str. Kerr 14]|uniref:D-ribose-binding protein n=2 Tax=Agrobacterium tumefaciens TaxID=358 RepID=A0A1S7SA66_AGRTU